MTYRKTGYIRGEASPLAKLTARQVLEIFQSPDKCEYLSAVYGVSPSLICRIKTGKRWHHLTKQLENVT
jgi:hypothetical protein